METINKKYMFSYNGVDMDHILNAEDVARGYIGKFKEVIMTKSSNKGLRSPQIGALSAIKAHLTLDKTPATIVLPTGTGKTEVIFSTILSLGYRRVLIIVPNDLLRKQTYDRAKKWGILKKSDCLARVAKNPNVVALLSNSIDDDKFKSIVENSNIVITTINILVKMNKEKYDFLRKWSEVLFIDEAHHITAKSWIEVRSDYLEKPIVQFTATPYRQDKKIVDGKIIYNYPMKKAIEEGYFKPIEFLPVEEYNISKENKKCSDLAISKKAIEVLKNDLEQGLKHVLLVRADTINRAKELYEKIYFQHKKYNPVLVTSELRGSNKKKIIKDIKALKHQIIVCVDMFGEGIDIPNLKIAALHDKFKSLPITLQFIGRFIRIDKSIGSAKIIANIADVSISDELSWLYKIDANWMHLLPQESEVNIINQQTISEIKNSFKPIGSSEIDLALFRPKVSMKAFKVINNDSWQPEKWSNVLSAESTYGYIDDKKNILILIYPTKTAQSWTKQENLKGFEWQYTIIYWLKEKKVVCVNTTDDNIGTQLLKVIFPKALTLISGEEIFRCLAGIKRLKLANIGLGVRNHGPISYKMFAGIDIEEGISIAARQSSVKSNLFGMGYEGDGPISIGCSYKGKVWSKMVENIIYWSDWCDKNINKIIDQTNDSKILSGVLIPHIITEFPKNSHPYRIEFGQELLVSKYPVKIETNLNSYHIEDCELNITSHNDNSVKFKLSCVDEDFNYSLDINKDGYKYSFDTVNQIEPYIIIGRKSKVKLSEYFTEYNVSIWFTGLKTLEGNTLSEPKSLPLGILTEDFFITKKWNNVDIKVESQLHHRGEKCVDSIQYYMIEELKKGEYDIIFDDDDAGEIADIIAIKNFDRAINIELYHCKFSHGDRPGARMSDLYEVCGQAEKSILWNYKIEKLFTQMLNRDQKRLERIGISRFEIGDSQTLRLIQNMVNYCKINLSVYIVQPGVSKAEITSEMKSILASTQDYAIETFNIPVKLICSC